MTRRELYHEIIRLAEPIYGAREASQIARMILCEMLGVDRTALVVEPDAEVEIEQRVLREVGEGRPIQYIIGEAEFCDMRFVVREGVLIPRPESEELVRWIVEEQSGGDILDIGTGSGALAIALRVALPDARVTALEISPEAREIARENIARLASDVTLVEGDALRGVEHFVDGEFDVILSNPPYIPMREEVDMRCNVTDYEPHLALFVPDDDPLIFYRAIARSAQLLLREGGALYFEIHENFAREMEQMLRDEGYNEVGLRLDINDKARMICARRE